LHPTLVIVLPNEMIIIWYKRNDQINFKSKVWYVGFFFFQVLKFSLENFLIEHEIKSDEPSKWWDAYLGSFVTPIWESWEKMSFKWSAPTKVQNSLRRKVMTHPNFRSQYFLWVYICPLFVWKPFLLQTTLITFYFWFL
jgi:hypothetical protein